MSYLVLARKYRPQKFEDVVGQEAVVRTLRNALERDRVSHAMIFSGVRGVGKTTLARIMAKALNCERTENPPCNTCESCREITEGAAIDLHEIDGASNRGIQEIRELKENIRFFPVKGRYKIIIIDEVHMLTTEAFNALLKTLEEPPDHVFFMFATTELHKVPVTILSRCQRYELKRIPFGGLVAFFRKIAQEEKVEISDTALEMIAREAEGSVRDGLSLLDQIFSFGGQQVKDEDVTQVLGLVDRSVFEKLAGSLLAGDIVAGMEVLHGSYTAGIDIKRFAHDLLLYFRALVICKTSNDHYQEILNLSDKELEGLRNIAAAHTAETLCQYFQILMKGVEELQHSPHPRMTLEMAFIRASHAGQVVPVTTLLERLDAVLAGAELKDIAPREIAAVSQAPKTAVAKAPPPPVESAPGPDVPGSAEEISATVPERKPEKPTEKAPEKVEAKEETAAPPEEVVKPEQKVDPGLARKGIRENWEDFIRYVMDRKNWMAHVLKLSAGGREEDGALMIRFHDKSDCTVLQEPANMKLLNEFAQDFFQNEFKVVIKIRGSADAGDSDRGPEAPQEERRALANDPLVQMTTEVFSGQVTGIRTGPRSR